MTYRVAKSEKIFNEVEQRVVNLESFLRAKSKMI